METQLASLTVHQMNLNVQVFIFICKKNAASACTFLFYLAAYLRLLDIGEPPRPNTNACSIPHRSRASRGGSIPSAHSRGRKRNSTWRTWLAS